MASFTKPAKSCFLTLISLAAVSAFSQPNESNLYGEIGYTMLTYQESGYKSEPGILRALIGTQLHPNWNLEGVFGVGISDGSTSVGNVTVTSQVDRFWGIYAKPKVMLSPDVELFGRVGYASSKVSASVPGYTISDSGSSLSYGAGINFKVAKNTSLNVDYMSYYNKGGIKATGITLGLGLKF